MPTKAILFFVQLTKKKISLSRGIVRWRVIACASKCDSWVNGKPKGWKSGGDASFLYCCRRGGVHTVPAWGGSVAEKKKREKSHATLCEIFQVGQSSHSIWEIGWSRRMGPQLND